MVSPRGTLALVLGLLLVGSSGCAAVGGTPVPGDVVVREAVDPSFVFGTDSSPVDELAATVVTDVGRYWERTMPRVFGREWTELDGGFFSVDTVDPTNSSPPCAEEVTELSGNAYYCVAVDAVVWDRAALLPVLRAHYGQSAVVLVLAHELGHAVQQRLDESPPARTDPVFVETTADCFAGSYFRWVVDGGSARLVMDDGDVEDALRALRAFADLPEQHGSDPHGDARDRSRAFRRGYAAGPGACAA
ncbi:neutral zinc metallopeptidase, partial [Actinopolyspora mortivallis]|uniref:neutral zinc metallopeptidase n=1 Tax=Actinopolyspora mortivallis TaxID=33906 RepID=UPI00039D52E3